MEMEMEKEDRRNNRAKYNGLPYYTGQAIIIACCRFLVPSSSCI